MTRHLDGHRIARWLERAGTPVCVICIVIVICIVVVAVR